MTEPTESEYMTRKEVADFLKIEVDTVYRWQRTGTLTAYRMGNIVRYKRDQVEQVLQPVPADKAVKIEQD